jgi:hypothetical protein
MVFEPFYMAEKNIKSFFLPADGIGFLRYQHGHTTVPSAPPFFLIIAGIYQVMDAPRSYCPGELS